VDGPQCHANQVVPATGLVDDAITPARKKGIVGQAGKPDLLPCRGNGFPAIRRRLTHGRVGYNWNPHCSKRCRGSGAGGRPIPGSPEPAEPADSESVAEVGHGIVVDVALDRIRA